VGAVVSAPWIRAQAPDFVVFAGGPYTGTVGQPVQFAATVEGGSAEFGATFSWDFGDGTTANIRTPQKAYQAPGTYVVTVTAINGTLVAQDTTTATITSGPPNIFAVSAGGPYVGTVGIPIRMISSVTGGIPTQAFFTWSFGDGTTGTGQVVSKVYTIPG